MQYDATLKQLFETQARGLLRVLTGSAEVREFLNVELPQVNVPRLDLLPRMADTGRLVNIEFQTTNEEWMAPRAGIYYLQSLVKHRVEHLDQVVLYLGKSPMKMSNAIETPVMRFQVRIVDIGELDGDALAASGDLGDAMLAVLAQVKDRQAAIRRALDRIATLKGKKRELAIQQMIILAGLRGLEIEVANEARRYMPFVVDLMENKVFQARYRQGVAEGEAKGRVEGEAKGRVEGEAKGRAQGEARMLRGQLERRFGSLPPWAQERLAGAATEQIEAWGLTLLDAETLEEVFGQT
jgi:predicted transposase YdaD